MPLLGKDATTYYSATLLTASSGAGSADSLTWTPVTNISDETDNFNPEVVDITTRAQAATGFGASVTVLNNFEISFTMLKELSDANFAALYAAIQSLNTPIALMFLSGEKTLTTSIGVAANWTFGLNWGKPIKGVQSQEWTARIYNFPQFVTGSGTL